MNRPAQHQAGEGSATTQPGPSSEGSDRAGPEVHLWREVAYIAGFYVLYSIVRNQFGSASTSPAAAYANAVRVIDVEKALGIFNEATVQSWFDGLGSSLWAVNVYYGTLHFLVPIAVLVYLARRHPRAYPLWRTTILATTGLALISFALFPLMPPRLLCDCPHGAGPVAAADGLPVFVDTLAVHGGLWSFDSETMERVSNQYAAMPSLHVAWALWCAFALVPLLRHRWARLLAVLYPVVTIWAVVVTGNHFWLDAVGGALVLAAGYAAARFVQAVMVNRRGDADTVTSELAADAGAARSAPSGSADGRRSTSQDTFAP